MLAILAAIVAGGGAAESKPGLARFSGDGMSFSHPSQWKARFAGYRAHYIYWIVALSTEHLQNPDCHFVPQPDGSSRQECNPILDSLPLNGVFIAWLEDDGPLQPDAKMTNVPGARTRIAGRNARIVIDQTSRLAGGLCPKHATESVTVQIAPRPGHGQTVVIACVNTFHFPRFMSQLLPVLRSVRFQHNA